MVWLVLRAGTGRHVGPLNARIACRKEQCRVIAQDFGQMGSFLRKVENKYLASRPGFWDNTPGFRRYPIMHVLDVLVGMEGSCDREEGADCGAVLLDHNAISLVI